MPNEVTVITPKGNKYTYYPEVIGAPFQNVPGNYMFAYQNINGTWAALYVGQSSDLGARLNSNHHKLDEAKRKGATHILNHINSNQQARLNEEAELIAWLKPVCNDQLK